METQEYYEYYQTQDENDICEVCWKEDDENGLCECDCKACGNHQLECTCWHDTCIFCCENNSKCECEKCEECDYSNCICEAWWIEDGM